MTLPITWTMFNGSYAASNHGINGLTAVTAAGNIGILALGNSNSLQNLILFKKPKSGLAAYAEHGSRSIDLNLICSIHDLIASISAHVLRTVCKTAEMGITLLLCYRFRPAGSIRTVTL